MESLGITPELVTRINGLTRFPLSRSTILRYHRPGNGLGKLSGERRSCWAWL